MPVFTKLVDELRSDESSTADHYDFHNCLLLFLTEAFRSHRSLALAKTELPASLWLEVVVLSRAKPRSIFGTSYCICRGFRHRIEVAPREIPFRVFHSPDSPARKTLLNTVGVEIMPRTVRARMVGNSSITGIGEELPVNRPE